MIWPGFINFTPENRAKTSCLMPFAGVFHGCSGACRRQNDLKNQHRVLRMIIFLYLCKGRLFPQSLPLYPPFKTPAADMIFAKLEFNLKHKLSTNWNFPKCWKNTPFFNPHGIWNSTVHRRFEQPMLAPPKPQYVHLCELLTRCRSLRIPSTGKPMIQAFEFDWASNGAFIFLDESDFFVIHGETPVVLTSSTTPLMLVLSSSTSTYSWFWTRSLAKYCN